MPSTTGMPDLIILLSRGRVDVRLWASEDRETPAGAASFQVQSIFLADQVAGAMDEALVRNPSLLDDFDQVEILMVDQPGVIIPSFYTDPENISRVASRYLRSRSGDMITSDNTPGEVSLAYSLPSGTYHALREYYSNAGSLHLSTVVWSALCTHERITKGPVVSRLFYLLIDECLVVLGEKEGRLMFARNFRIHGPADLVYFAVACSRMLRPDEHWQVTLAGESSKFEMPYTSFFTFHHHLQLPGLQHLIAHHRSCVS